jgi:hypothetical protein
MLSHPQDILGCQEKVCWRFKVSVFHTLKEISDRLKYVSALFPNGFLNLPWDLNALGWALRQADPKRARTECVNFKVTDLCIERLLYRTLNTTVFQATRYNCGRYSIYSYIKIYVCMCGCVGACVCVSFCALIAETPLTTNSTSDASEIHPILSSILLWNIASLHMVYILSTSSRKMQNRSQSWILLTRAL